MAADQPAASSPRRRGLLLLVVAWLAFISLPPIGLSMLRQQLLLWQSSPTAQQEWDRFARRCGRSRQGPGR